MSRNNMIRWSGLSLILAGGLIALAVIIHPAKETPQLILAEEFRLVTGHWLFTFYCAFLMLGLPGLYAAHAGRLGRPGLAGFLMLFFGTLLFAVSGDYGFNAPVLARLAPQTLDAINTYPPVMAMDGLFVVLLIVGFILFGIAIWRSHTLPAWSGVLIAVGFPLFILASGLSLTVFASLWIAAVLGAVLLGLGLAWVGYRLWSRRELAQLQPTG